MKKSKTKQVHKSYEPQLLNSFVSTQATIVGQDSL